jgi:hypothetical protein
MKALLDNRFAPITFTFGFVESPFDRLSEAFARWQQDLDAKFKTRTEITRFVAPLREALYRLEPLTDPIDRDLLAETRSNWTGIFSNGLRGNDVASPVGYLSRLLLCRGLTVSSVPDRSLHADNDAIRIYGAVAFTLYGPERTDWLNRVRHVSVTNDVSGWKFAATGEVQPYEQVDKYKNHRLIERFTPEMLESYCRALGIEIFDDTFYGGQSLVSHVTNRLGAPGAAMSISEARSLLHIPGI